ncbi:MAG: hypothetical protein R3Y47_06855 [Lachnospiraceae bacterium]
MKKYYALLLATLLLVMTVVPAMAAVSPTVETTTTTTTTTTPAVTMETEVDAPARSASVAVADAAVAVLYEDTKAEVASVTSNPTHLTNLDVNVNATLVSSFELVYSGDIPAGGVQVPVAVDTLTVGQYAYVLHRNSETGTWEKVGEGLVGEDLTIVCTFTNFSPVAVLAVDASEVATTVESPKTGQ